MITAGHHCVIPRIIIGKRDHMSSGSSLLRHCARNIANGTRIVISTCESRIRHCRVCHRAQIRVTYTCSPGSGQTCRRLNEILVIPWHVRDTLLHELHVLVRINLRLVVRHSRCLNVLTNHWNIWDDSGATLGRGICHLCIGQSQ